MSKFEPTNHPAAEPGLKRALGLPLLVFYGLGVTVGAGIFALIGEILGMAGEKTALAFLIAGLIAVATARSYALLARRYPKAAGAAVYAEAAFGAAAGRFAGLGVTLIAIVSSAAIAVAFTGYVASFLPLPSILLVVLLLALLGAVAWYGVRESVVFAAVITVLEVGTLAIIAMAGFPALKDAALWQAAFLVLPEPAMLAIVLPAAAVAFFAFIGFEDIVNMAEEVHSPERTIGWAIGITLAVTTLLYVLLALVATGAPDRAAIAGSGAPLADLFAQFTGLPAWPVSLLATLAMVNGILVQIIMASRVIYGMSREKLLPAWFGAVDPVRRTPTRAIAVVTAIIAVLALAAPLIQLATATSYMILAIFALVNLSLIRIARRAAGKDLKRGVVYGAIGFALSAGLLLYEIVRLAF